MPWLLHMSNRPGNALSTSLMSYLVSKQSIHLLPAYGANAFTQAFCWYFKSLSPLTSLDLYCPIDIFLNKMLLNPTELFVFHRLSKLAGEELSALQARNFSSAGDISAHASGVRVLVLRVLKAAVSLTKAKGGKQDLVSRLASMPFLSLCFCTHTPQLCRCLHSNTTSGPHVRRYSGLYMF